MYCLTLFSKGGVMLVKIIAFIILFSQSSFAKLTDASAPVGGGSCGEIKVDCGTHKISIGGKDEIIDCGADGKTISGSGKVGGPHNGQVVPDGVEIQTPRMGQEGGGKVFHEVLGGGDPTGSDNSKGCIHVTKAVLGQLKSCQGAPLTIVGTDGDKGAPGKGDGKGVSVASSSK